MSSCFECGMWENNGNTLARSVLLLSNVRKQGSLTIEKDICWSEQNWASYRDFVKTGGARLDHLKCCTCKLFSSLCTLVQENLAPAWPQYDVRTCCNLIGQDFSIDDSRIRFQTSKFGCEFLTWPICQYPSLTPLCQHLVCSSVSDILH